MASINSFVRELRSYKCERAAPGLKDAGVTLFRAATLIAIIIAPRRACAIRVPLRPAASEGEGTYVFVPTAGASPRGRRRRRLR